MRTNAAVRATTPDRDKLVQQQVDSLLLRLQPTPVADERRRAVLRYVQAVVEKQVPTCKVFPVGSFPLKTYLPCADVDMVMFAPPRAPSDVTRRHPWGEIKSTAGAGPSGSRSGLDVGLGLDATTYVDGVPATLGEKPPRAPVPALVAVNQALCAVAAQTGCGRRSSAAGDEPARVEIRNVSFINARTPIVTMVVGNVVVDLTENQGGSVAASVLLEEADRWIGRDHLFKRSLLLLKAWALCETSRIVGQRILGAREGGLTSYGLSVMVLYLFALKSSADTLTHPVDVLVGFFQFYSEFDWGRHCLTLDGPVAFDEVRNSGGVRDTASACSQLWPLVDRVQAHLSPDPVDKAGRSRGRCHPPGTTLKCDHPNRPPRTYPAYWGVAQAPATAHFPVRHCNIQDPLNSLNNLGHSVSRRSLKALESALKKGRQQLEHLRVSPPPSPPLPPSPPSPASPPPSNSRYSSGTFPSRASNLQQRRTRKVDRGEVTRLNGRLGDAPSGVSHAKDPSRVAEDRNANGGGCTGLGSETSAPLQSTPPPGQQIGSSSALGPVPQAFVPHLQYLRLPRVQSTHPGAIYGPTQNVQMAAASPSGPHQILPLNPSLPGGYQYQFVLHPYVVPQHQVGPGLAGPPPSTVLVPAAQLHPEFLRQWNLPRIAQLGFQSELPPQQQQEMQQQQQMFGGMASPQVPLGGHAASPHQQGVRNRVDEQHVKPRSAAMAEEGRDRKRCPPSADPKKTTGAKNGKECFVNSNCVAEGARREWREEDRGQPFDRRSMRGPILPWGLPTFIHSSPTSSTASMSEFAEDGGGGKDEQEFQSAYESGEEFEAARGRARRGIVVDAVESRVNGTGAKNNVVASKPTTKRGGGGSKKSRRAAAAAAGGGGCSANDGGASENLWENHWFLREFFPHCCQVYASGDGFREDLLDHPCQHWSKHQEKDLAPQRRLGSRDILEGSSEDIWRALETVGRMMREGGTSNEEDGMDKTISVPSESSDAHNRARKWCGEGTQIAAANAEAGSRGGSFAAGDPQREQAGSGGEGVAEGLARCESEAVGAVALCRSGDGRRPMTEPDEDTGYTTSEDQGEKAESPAGSSSSHGNVAVSAPSPKPTPSPAPPVDRRVPPPSPEAAELPVRYQAPPASASASTQTEFDAPEPPTQYGPEVAETVCKGVQCSLPLPVPDYGARRATREAAEADSDPIVDVEPEHDALAEEDPAEGTVAGVEAARKGTTEKSGKLVAATRAEARTEATAEAESAADGNAKPKKKRKKGKSAGVGVAAQANGDLHVASLSKAVLVTRSGPAPWADKQAWVWMAAFFGVLSLVLAGTWGGARVSGELRGDVDVLGSENGQPPPSFTVDGHRENAFKDRVQPPMWVVVGSNLTLGDIVTSPRASGKANGAGVFQWYKNGRPILGQTRSFLTLTAAGVEDEGTYTCFAVGGSNQALWRETNVRVSEPPSVESQFQTQRLGRGEMLVIVATARGNPPPEYQWRRNGVPIPGANRPMFVKHSVAEIDVGTYTCDVFNLAGSAQWEEMAVILREDSFKDDSSRETTTSSRSERHRTRRR